VGASPTRQPLQPEAIGAVIEETKWLKPSISVSRIGDSAVVELGPRDDRGRVSYAQAQALGHEQIELLLPSRFRQWLRSERSCGNAWKNVSPVKCWKYGS
jgi:hypothetical protein